MWELVLGEEASRTAAGGKCLNFRGEIDFSKLKMEIGKKTKTPIVKENQPTKIVLGMGELIATFLLTMEECLATY